MRSSSSSSALSCLLRGGGCLVLLLFSLPTLEVEFAQFKMHNLLDCDVTNNDTAVVKGLRRLAWLWSPVHQLMRCQVAAPRHQHGGMRGRWALLQVWLEDKLVFRPKNVRAEHIRVFGESVDGVDSLLCNTIPFFAVGVNLEHGGKLGQDGVVVGKFRELPISLDLACRPGIMRRRAMQVYLASTRSDLPKTTQGQSAAWLQFP